MSNSIAILDAALRMAEAIKRHRAIRQLDVVGKDGRTRYSLDCLSADYELDEAERSYREAAGEDYQHDLPRPPRLKPEELIRRHPRTVGFEGDGEVESVVDIFKRRGLAHGEAA